MLKSLKSSVTNTLVYGLGNLASKLVGFILIPIYTNYFSTEVYGILGIVEVSIAALISIFCFALYQAFYRWYWDKQYSDRQKSIFFTLLVFLFFVVLLLVANSWLFAYNISVFLFGFSTFSDIVKLLFVVSGLQILMQLVSTLMQLQQKAKRYTYSSFLTLALQLSFTLYFIIKLKLGLEGIYYAQLISFFAYFLFNLSYIIENSRLKIELMIFKDMFKYALPLLLSNIAALVLSITDRYFLRIFGSLSDLGVYQFGYKIANTLSVLIISSAQMAVNPLLFQKIDDPNNKRFYSKVLTYFTFVTMLFVLGFVFFSFEIVKLLGRNIDYWPSIKIIPIIVFGILFSMMKDTVSIGLYAKKRTDIMSTIVIIIAIFSIFINWVLISYFDSIGAAVSFLISQFLFFILIYFYAQKYFYVPYELLKIAKMVIIGLCLYLISIFVNDLDLLIRLIIKLFLVAIFPILLYFWRFFEPVEIQSIKGAVFKWRNPVNWKSNITELLKGGKA